MEKCNVSCLKDKEGDEALEETKKKILGSDHPLYEAFAIDGNGMVATPDGLRPTNDHFAWGPKTEPGELKGTKGTFKINGTFSYYPGAQLPAAMVPDPKLASKTLPTSKNDPMPNVKAAATKPHWIEVTWNFCDEKIVVSGKDSEGGVY